MSGGPERGELDTARVLGASASELKRQGFAKTLAVSLTCSGRPHGLGHEFTVTATTVQLEQLENVRGSLSAKFDFNSAVKTQPAIVHSQHEIGSAVTAAVLGVLGLPFARFVRGDHDENRPLHRDADETIDLHLQCPDDGPCTGNVYLFAVRLPGNDANGECAGVDGYFELRDDQPPRWNPASEDLQSVRSIPVTEHRVRMDWFPDKEGVYLLKVLASVSSYPKEAQATSFRCVTVGRERAEFWGDAGYAKSPFTVGPFSKARAESVSYTHIVAGMTFEPEIGAVWKLGFAVGYARTDHDRGTTATWGDAVAAAGQSSPQGPQQSPTVYYSRQAAIFGPIFTWSWESLLCFRAWQCTTATRMLGFEVRMEPLIDIGALQVSDDVAAAYPSFFQNSKGVDVKLSAALQAGFRVHLDHARSVYLMVDSVIGGLSDLALNNRAEDLAKPTYGGFLAIGFVAGLAWGL